MNSKRKGADGERDLAKFLQKHGQADARRGQQYCGLQGDADVVGVSDHLHIECKYRANGHGNTYEWLAQAKRDAREGEIPTVWHKKVSKQHRGNSWLVTLEAEDFLVLLNAYERTQDSNV